MHYNQCTIAMYRPLQLNPLFLRSNTFLSVQNIFVNYVIILQVEIMVQKVVSTSLSPSEEHQIYWSLLLKSTKAISM